MKAFAGIRLGLWILILGLCVVVTGLNLSLQQTILKPSELQSWATRSHLAKTFRDTVIAPRIIAAARIGEPTGFALLPASIITKSLDHAIPPQTLNTRLAPVATAVAKWLNSGSGTLKFSVNVADLQTKFFTTLNTNLAAEIAQLPNCTSNNSYNDVQNGVCAYDAATSRQLQSDTLQALKDNSSDVFSTTLTEASLPQSAKFRTQPINAPNALNILNSAALFAGGVFILIVLWLLVHRRLVGLIAIGASGLLGAAGLFTIGSFIHYAVKSSTISPLYTAFVGVASSAVTGKMTQIALFVAGAGVGLILIGWLLRIVIHTRRHATDTPIRL